MRVKDANKAWRPINVPEFLKAIRDKKVKQYTIAEAMGCGPATFNHWLHGRVGAPLDLRERVETFLNLPPGSLAAASTVPLSVHVDPELHATLLARLSADGDNLEDFIIRMVNWYVNSKGIA